MCCGRNGDGDDDADRGHDETNEADEDGADGSNHHRLQ